MKQREGSRWIKERKNKKGRLLCLVPICNNLREKRKYKSTISQTRNYCKKHGFEDMRPFTNWQGLREKAFKRDNYSCVKCGDNRKEVKIMVKRRRWINLDEYYKKLSSSFGSKEIKLKYEKYEVEEIRNNLIGDHIIPIALGGDEFDIDNIQTLCIKCNNIKTREDAKKIAKLRRKENEM